MDRREDRGRMPYAGVGACFVCVGVGGWVVLLVVVGFWLRRSTTTTRGETYIGFPMFCSFLDPVWIAGSSKEFWGNAFIWKNFLRRRLEWRNGGASFLWKTVATFHRNQKIHCHL